jgi:hypothetical protein
MPRKARLDAPGTLHHVIIRGIERRPIVDDDKDRENFVSRLGQHAAETETGIFAWTLVTNHAHTSDRSCHYIQSSPLQAWPLISKSLPQLNGT